MLRIVHTPESRVVITERSMTHSEDTAGVSKVYLVRTIKHLVSGASIGRRELTHVLRAKKQ